MTDFSSGKVVAIASAFAVVVTIWSLSELHTLTRKQEDSQVGQYFVTHSEWKQIADRALEHIENFPGRHAGAKSVTLQTSIAVSSPSSSVASSAPAKKVPAAKVSTAGLDKGTCNKADHTEYWGDVVKAGTINKVSSWEECCQQCQDYKSGDSNLPDCNVWVWCGEKGNCANQYQECWLKHLAHPDGAAPAHSGPSTPWTSGSKGASIEDKDIVPIGGPDRKFHTITTASGTSVHWQARVHYYWYLKHKAECDKSPTCEMGGFTRLLHSGAADDLMDEIPSMVVDPLPKSIVDSSWYVVLNRPYAFVQWCKLQKIPEKYVLMSEPDHVFLRPLPNFMKGNIPAAFPFFYIEPSNPKTRHITKRFVGDVPQSELDTIAPIGNSPTFLSVEQMKQVMPIWMNLSIAIFKDPEANKEWGWVQEMYAFTFALYKTGVRKVDLYLNMMSQPPWDTKLNYSPHRPFYIIHFTYGMDYKLTGEFTPGKFGEWRFDKRTYGGRPPPRHLGEPPKGMQNDLVRALINSINEATEALPCWDEYHETGVVKPCKTGVAGQAAAAGRAT